MASVAAGLLLLAGCATVHRGAGFPEVQRVVTDSLGEQQVHWYQGAPEDAAAGTALDTLLERPLSVDDAVQVALLGNPALQALYEDLGVAQADLVQAGLLRNPVFAGSFRPSTSSPSGTNVELDLVQDFLTLLFLPSRKRLASAQFTETQLRVADAVLKLAADVRRTYFELQAAKNVVAVLRTSADVADASADLASRFHDAGNMSDLALATEQVLSEQLRLEVARAEAATVPFAEQLDRLLGLADGAPAWSIADTLPPLPPGEAPLDELEAIALAKRPDVRAARQEIEVLSQALGIVRTTRWVPFLEGGARAERDPNGQWVVGPSLALELPIFDQGQPAAARLESQLRQTERRLEAKRIAARSEIRAARAGMVSARELVGRYRQVLIPLRERIVALSLQEYNFMLVGAFDVLVAKQAEIDTYRDYVGTLRDYWIARSELEHAIAGPLPRSAEASTDAMEEMPAVPTAPPGMPSHQHDHGGH